MNPIEFQRKWIGVELKERSASQEHFLDLCRVLRHATPAEMDREGTTFTFERGAAKSIGGQGWADIWYRGHFAWEYKGPHKDLVRAYDQLLRYKDDLENPPLLIVSDLNRIEIHTNFTGTVKNVHVMDLHTLAEPANLAILRRAFYEPYTLRPGITVAGVTEEAARQFGTIARGMHARGEDPHRAAHYLVQLLFCLFAEDVGLLPNGIFSKMVAAGVRNPGQFDRNAADLLTTMNAGGSVAYEDIPRFNGGLFAVVDVPILTADDIRILQAAAGLDWSSIEPSIFGTLFERSLDPSQRAQLGAHYTGRADIERVVEPVVMAPLLRRWEAVREEADALRDQWQAAQAGLADTSRRIGDRRAAVTRTRNAFAEKVAGFQEELAAVRILDPACGSGNFLYVALARLLDLEKDVLTYRANSGLPMGFPAVRPHQVLGLEVNEYAQQLAQVAIWIGYLQWMIGNGFTGISEPVLDPLETIRLQDALLTSHEDGHVSETVWPTTDYIVGNPPFLGSQKLRRELGTRYTTNLYNTFASRLPNGSDLSCYFFEKARHSIEEGNAKRAGLLATQSIRTVRNREVLRRIKRSGDIYMAWSDEPWILNGASVRISIVGFDDGKEANRTLDGERVEAINADLTSQVDVSVAVQLLENAGIAFEGDKKAGPFDIEGQLAREWNALPANPNGKKNSDVVRPWVNGRDITGRGSDKWIIDFGVEMTMEDAALYEAPFQYIQANVYPQRCKNNDAFSRQNWWLHQRPRPELRDALKGLGRFIVTPRVSSHRFFDWLPICTLPDSRLFAFAREDDFFFGVLHSRAHEVWTLRMGARHGVGNDPTYNGNVCFRTFPLPWPPGSEPTDDPRVTAIAEAAANLDRLRRNWLDPEGATEAELKKRTLTNLYNQRPTWLQHAHASLDRAVWAAYGWDDPEPAAVEEDTILARLLVLNVVRAASEAV